MRSCSWSPLIELKEFDVLPETAIDSVAPFGSTPGIGIPEGTTSLIVFPLAILSRSILESG